MWSEPRLPGELGEETPGLAIAVIFPGQGTQGALMGAPWREHDAWGVVDRAEQALGEPLAHLLLAESADELARTRESQLSVLLTSLVVWEEARGRLDTAPVAFAGHSLGQITALIASGCLPFDEGIRLAARRAEATQAAADRHPGRMAAVIGSDEAQVLEACGAAPDECWLANDNAPGQIVISGDVETLQASAPAFRALGARVMDLPVGGAFHSPLMADGETAFAPVLEAAPFRDGRVPVVSNYTAAPARTAEDVKAALRRQITGKVRWRESVEAMLALGVDTFVEVGPGKVLSSLVQRCTRGQPVKILNVEDPASLEKTLTAVRGDS
jgi:[acyl-carrier-protein] S-malonyltransferase